MTEPRFTTMGKEVLHDGEHYADARSVEVAVFLADAMNKSISRTVKRIMREILATRLRGAAVVQSTIADAVERRENDRTKHIFANAAALMTEAAKELSDV